MKIIDLLNKIANGEEVPKVIKKEWKYEWQYDESREEYTYMQKTGERFDDDWLVINMLNDEVEIPEATIKQDNKIQKIHIDKDRIQSASTDNYCYSISQPMKIMINKINELIDKLNKEE